MGDGDILEKLHAVLNDNKINYDKNKDKLLTRYFLPQH